MFVAGLERFVAPAGSEETSEDDRILSKQLLLSDPFISLAKRLKDTLAERCVKKGTIWMTDDDRAQPSFRVVFVDKARASSAHRFDYRSLMIRYTGREVSTTENSNSRAFTIVTSHANLTSISRRPNRSHLDQKT